MTALVKLTAQFAETTVDDETVVMHLASGEFFSLTGSAKAIWDQIDGVRSQSAIVAALVAEFAVSPAEIAPDVDEFVARLRTAGLLALR